MKRIALLLYTLLLFGCFGGRPTYDITRYGARTSKANNAVAINKAIDDCHRHGGGTVTVPEGTFITGTVIMKGGVTLHLDKGATLKAIAIIIDSRQSNDLRFITQERLFYSLHEIIANEKNILMDET